MPNIPLNPLMKVPHVCSDLRIRFPLTPNCGLLDLIRPRPSNLRAATHFYCSIKKGNANILLLFNCSKKLYGHVAYT